MVGKQAMLQKSIIHILPQSALFVYLSSKCKPVCPSSQSLKLDRPEGYAHKFEGRVKNDKITHGI